MEFNFRKSKIYKAVVFSEMLVFGPFKFWYVLLFVIGFISFGFYGFNLLISPILKSYLRLNLSTPFLSFGWAYILIPLGFSILFLDIFFNYYLKRPQIKPDSQNIAEFFDFDAAVVFKGVTSVSGLLLSIVRYKPARSIFVRLGINPIDLSKQLRQEPDINKDKPEELSALINDVNNLRVKHGGENITLTDFLASLFDYSPVFKQLMINGGLDKNDLEMLSVWYEADEDFQKKHKEFWLLENLLHKSPIGTDWIYGYSWYLSHYATDITRQFSRYHTDIELIGRQKIIDQVEQILARSGQNNVLLVGDPGVGKRTVLMGFSQMIADGKAVPELNYKRVFELNVPLITSSSKDVTEVQNTLISLFNEAVKAGNVILVIEDFHNFIGALGGMGRTDISEILTPYLESSGIQVVATTDSINFHKYMEPRAEILKVFEKVEVAEPGIRETMRIVEGLVPAMESHFGVLITYSAIKNTVESSDKYITNMPFPEKAVNLLAEAVSRVKSQKKSIVLSQDINELITLKTNIPLGEAIGSEKERLINLEEEMHKEIIGQEEAVRAIANTMQRLRAGLSKRNKPAGVFLFVGPTGVGKTLTAKILAKMYFGSQNRITRFDMSEYQDAESLDRFLGSLRINEPGQLASKVRDNPFSVILLDEIEKAHKNILNIFLSIFDEGRMTDVFGRKVNFEQSVIIATSNAAADVIRDMVNQGLDPSAQKEKVINALVGDHYFSPEFLNRFDDVVIFHPLNQEQLYKVAEILIDALTERLREQGHFFKSTPEIIDYISKVGFDPQFGARPMHRAVQDKLETLIARKILEGTIRKGEEFSLSLEEIMVEK